MKAASLNSRIGVRGTWSALWIGVIVVGFVLISLVASPDLRCVVAPMIGMLAAVAFFFGGLRRRQGVPGSYFEIGAVYFMAASLYSVVPLLGYILNGFEYSSNNDWRLYMGQPSPEEVGHLGWYYVVHMWIFAVAYFACRGAAAPLQPQFSSPRGNTILVAFLLFAGIRVFLWVVGVLFDLSAESYVESYVVFARLPLIVAQVVSHLSGAAFTVELVLLAAMFANYRKFRLWIFAWLVVTALLTIVHLGARTQLVLLILTCGFFYDRLVRPVPARVVATLGATVLFGFLVFGLVRNGRDWNDLISGNGVLSHGNEFEGLFANVVDLERRKEAGQITLSPVSLWLCDFTLLIPQQIAPFIKISPGAWYMETFYPDAAAEGHGSAFGTIAAAVAGWGWPDLIARSALLGGGLAWIHRYCARHRRSFWAFIFYVWAVAWVYQLFRNTTFYLVPLFFYRFVPVYLLIRLLGGIEARRNHLSCRSAAWGGPINAGGTRRSIRHSARLNNRSTQLSEAEIRL